MAVSETSDSSALSKRKHHDSTSDAEMDDGTTSPTPQPQQQHLEVPKKKKARKSLDSVPLNVPVPVTPARSTGSSSLTMPDSADAKAVIPPRDGDVFPPGGK